MFDLMLPLAFHVNHNIIHVDVNHADLSSHAIPSTNIRCATNNRESWVVSNRIEN